MLGKQSMIVVLPVVVIALIITSYIVVSQRDGADLNDEVLAIVSKGQAYSGEFVDKLVALGPEAVPAIGRALNREEKFPRKYVLALAEIGD